MCFVFLRITMCDEKHAYAGSHTKSISSVAISPSNKAIIFHLWDIALLQYDRSCINESVLFVSDILLYCLVI